MEKNELPFLGKLNSVNGIEAFHSYFSCSAVERGSTCLSIVNPLRETAPEVIMLSVSAWNFYRCFNFVLKPPVRLCRLIRD